MLLGAVQRMTRLGRDELRNALETAGISQQGLLGERSRLPDALGGAVPVLPDRSRPGRRRPTRSRRAGPRPRHEVLKMMERLARRLEGTGQ